MQSISFSGLGLRTKNEDYHYTNDNLYIVCDGVGGSPYGEVASKLACSTISDFFASNPFTAFDFEYFQKALQYSIEKFKETEAKYPEMKGMSTTVVLIAFDIEGAIIAWLGDSRLYHIRPNKSGAKILFKTEDHSLINDLRKQGTPSEGYLKQIRNYFAKHPFNYINKIIRSLFLASGKLHKEKRLYPEIRNYITKALSASCRDKFSLHRIMTSEIHNEDFLFLCTDGVLENITEAKIQQLFSTQLGMEEIKFKILNECESKTNDNFTFQLIKV